MFKAPPHIHTPIFTKLKQSFGMVTWGLNMKLLSRLFILDVNQDWFWDMTKNIFGRLLKTSVGHIKYCVEMVASANQCYLSCMPKVIGQPSLTAVCDILKKFRIFWFVFIDTNFTLNFAKLTTFYDVAKQQQGLTLTLPLNLTSNDKKSTLKNQLTFFFVDF